MDQIDIHRLLRRAADAISPILDRLYAKALKSEQLISDPTISKFDLNFWLQNAQRQLRSMSILCKCIILAPCAMVYMYVHVSTEV